MVGIISEYAVKSRVAILQTSHVDRNHRYTWLEYLLIRNQQSCGTRYTTDENVHVTSHINNAIDDFKINVLVICKTFHKQLCLFFVSYQLNMKHFLRFLLKDTK